MVDDIDTIAKSASDLDDPLLEHCGTCVGTGCAAFVGVSEQIP